MNRYWSDPHFGHGNIIGYTGRPFKNVFEMNTAIINNVRRVLSTTNDTLYCMGDISLHLPLMIERHGEPLWPSKYAYRMFLIIGNHDRRRKYARQYDDLFSWVVGDERTWQTNTMVIDDFSPLLNRKVRLLLSHKPQDDLMGCDFNVHGHIHEKAPWSVKALNACVEHTGYEPVTFDDLYAINVKLRCTQPEISTERVPFTVGFQP